MRPFLSLLREAWSADLALRLALRVLLPVAALGMGAWGLTAAETTAGPPLPFGEAFYRAIQFFALGGDRFPVGGPLAAQVALWGALFLAPLSVTAALLEGAAFVWIRLASPEMRARWLRDHVIVCGAGSHGRAIAALARSCQVPVVMVERADAGGGSQGVDGRREAPVIRGDLTDPSVLARAGLDRAAAVFFASGNAVTNLNGSLVAWNATAAAPSGPVLVPLVDEDGIPNLLMEEFGLPEESRVAPISQFRSAAEAMVGHLGNVDARLPLQLVIVGFGRFGRAVALAIQAWTLKHPDREVEVVVVDPEAEAKVQEFRVCSELAIHSRQTSARAWAAGLAPGRGPSEARRMVFQCIDDDVENLRCGAILRLVSAETVIVLRMFDPPRSLRDAPPASACGTVVAMNVSEQLKLGLTPTMALIAERHRTWWPRGTKDRDGSSWREVRATLRPNVPRAFASRRGGSPTGA